MSNYVNNTFDKSNQSQQLPVSYFDPSIPYALASGARFADDA